RAFAQYPHDQVAIIQWREAHPDGNVYALADHVDTSVRAFHLHLHAWTSSQKRRQYGAKLVVQQGRRATDAHRSLRLGADKVNRLLRSLCFDQHGLAMAVIGLADLSDRKLSGRALDQAHTQAFFEQG